ncbi:mitogen-activated protein kinase kinase kinase 20-like [Diospyros lotus]|uniref:mitogen-activated protein kinase kinase kinase 20-like n=1 Tax=Diospyros lotus TaxID=55363 RepID=UPI002253B81C|nr:mitogen-activated protein kinase kinase kinase 20-like [Diospyros lotus]
MGSWIKKEFLGKGSYGTVSKAVPLTRELADSNDDDDDDIPSIMASEIAVKSADFKFSTSLQKEGEIMFLLSDCPGIIRCYGEDISDEKGKRVYNLLLEFAPGGSLKSLIERRGGALPESEVRRYTRMILKALNYVHEKGYVHCGIKPHNILVFPSQDGNGNYVKIANFGLAKKADEGNGLSGDPRLMGHSRGTLPYSSPESIVWNMNKPPVDIWALGCTVSQMMTGRSPWECTHRLELKWKIILGRELPRIPDTMSSQGKDFLLKCFERDWKTRSTAADLLRHPFVEGERADEMPLLQCAAEDARWVSRVSMFKEKEEDPLAIIPIEFYLPSFLRVLLT